MLQPGQYQPENQPITITKNLNIVADHSFQTPLGTGANIEVNGSMAQAAALNNLFVVQTGVTLRMDGFNFDAARSDHLRGGPGQRHADDLGNDVRRSVRVRGGDRSDRYRDP